MHHGKDFRFQKFEALRGNKDPFELGGLTGCPSSVVAAGTDLADFNVKGCEHLKVVFVEGETEPISRVPSYLEGNACYCLIQED